MPWFGYSIGILIELSFLSSLRLRSIQLATADPNRIFANAVCVQHCFPYGTYVGGTTNVLACVGRRCVLSPIGPLYYVEDDFEQN